MREYNNDVDISIFFNKRRVLLVHSDGGTGVPTAGWSDGFRGR